MYLIKERTTGSLELSTTSYTPGRTPRRQSAAVIQRRLVTLAGSSAPNPLDRENVRHLPEREIRRRKSVNDFVA